MSDSGRVMGDCKHGHLPDWCLTCLREERNRLLAASVEAANHGARLEAEVERLRTALTEIRRSIEQGGGGYVNCDMDTATMHLLVTQALKGGAQ